MECGGVGACRFSFVSAIHAVRALETLRHAAGDLPDKGSDAVDTVVDGNAKGEEDTGNKGDKNGADTKAAVGGDAILSTNPKLLWLVQQCPPKLSDYQLVCFLLPCCESIYHQYVVYMSPVFTYVHASLLLFNALQYTINNIVKTR